MNNLRHGAASESLFIKGEDPEQFFSLLENAFEQFQPAFDQDAICVTRLVKANWILDRRERAAAQFENQLYERKPDGKYFVPKTDIHEINLVDRYITTAERRLINALKTVQLIQKMNHDANVREARWQKQFEQQKEIIVSQPATAHFLQSLNELTKEVRDNDADNNGPHIAQSVFAAFDHQGAIIAHDTSPKNGVVAQLAAAPNAPKRVVRTYHFKGRVPEKYHWLFTDPDKQRNLTYQEIRKPMSFDDWQSLVASE